MTPALIGLDWGTSSLRGYLLASDDTIIEEHAAPLGIMQIPAGQFATTLNDFCGPWIARWPELPLLASGMIGSKQGWHEAPYCTCPADAHTIAAAMIKVETSADRPLYIVPGVSTVDAVTSVPDVMRGEETQIIGAVPSHGSHLVVLPGTHSKWAWVMDGVITHFSSWMTGEVYAALINHTILGRLMQGDAAHDAAAFARGVAYGFEQPGQLLSRVFSARTLGLFEQLGNDALSSYLSGVLIGSEIGGATASGENPDSTLILGSTVLSQRYASAFTLVQRQVKIGPADSAARGLMQLARSAKLLP